MQWRAPLVGVVLALGTSRTGAQSSAAPVVIYLHGRIIEEQGPAAISPEFGAYQYDAILDSLRVAGQVDSLLKAGIPAARIAVVGFSKGGGIAIQAAARLHRTDLTFVFMGACGDGNVPFKVAGRVLSVFEASDSLGRSCAALFATALPGTTHEERQIHTGLKHGAFYQPRSEWLEPVRAWIRRTPPTG